MTYLLFTSYDLLARQCVFSFPPLIVVPLSSHEVDGVRKEKERLTAAINLMLDLADNYVSIDFYRPACYVLLSLLKRERKEDNENCRRKEESSVRLGHNRLRTLMKRSSLWYLLGVLVGQG